MRNSNLMMRPWNGFRDVLGPLNEDYVGGVGNYLFPTQPDKLFAAFESVCIQVEQILQALFAFEDVPLHYDKGRTVYFPPAHSQYFPRLLGERCFPRSKIPIESHYDGPGLSVISF